MSDALSRRAFAARIAMLSAASFILADLPPLTAAEPGAVATPPRPRQDPEPSALARTLAETVRLRFPDRLTEEQLATITRSIDSRLRGLEQLYRVSLSNGDEPDFVFAAFRGAD